MRRPLIAAACLIALTGCAGNGHAGHESTDHAGHDLAPTTPASAPAQAPVTSASGSAAPAVGDYNLADVMFLQMAVANHNRGIELVHLADKRPIREDLRNLSAAIRLTQEQELEQMKKWLTEWSQSTDVNPDPNAHAHHGGMPVTDAQSLAELGKLPDGEFEKQFIALLTAHQHNAVEFALTEGKEGASTPVKAFADKVVKSRTGQIQQLLNYQQQ
ncbi:DUF305 domain-containing protein [Actinokineospora globicatena]|uniref:DUF305 domain-containing protein n=1 Tax=Actinokineospora globicatena TaxID=103729 RepID=A0A9W6QTF1_9PSEU|nr:DUF305 domain-containing protein [Actinokineospora globicatena]MCP2306382.1 Uncharacterized conserved protein, DUF305 family [Actinokineospora globicatena]GLW81808.1 hypothetical protein Aglo01_62890 [Actinokineospora globicatena]GLW95232.1 hypothetical protein Aglo03_60480 [Actinokineospora globicatena]